MVGPAYTLSFIPSREDIAVAANIASPTNPQRAAIEAVPPGHVLIMDARGDLGGGNLGDILIARLLYRGVAGVVTDGRPRQRGVADLNFPTFCAGFCGAAELLPHHGVRRRAADRLRRRGGFPGDIVTGDS